MIDPNIALGFNPPVQANVGQAALTGLNLQAAAMKPALMQAQTENLQAQTPGLEAQSQSAAIKANQDARSLAAQQWFGTNASKYQTEDGGINMPGLIADASNKGFADLVPGLAKSWSDQAQNNIKTASDKNALADAIQKSGVQAAGVLAQTAAAVPPDLRSDVIQAGIAHLGSIYGANSPVVTQITGMFANPTEPADAETTNFILGAKNATLTAQQQKQLEIDQENADTAKTNAGTTYQNMLISGRTQTDANGAMLQSSTTDLAQSSRYQAGVDTIAKLPEGTIPQNVTGQKLTQWVGQHPELSNWFQAVQEFNQAHGTTLNPTDPGARDTIANEAKLKLISGNASYHVYQAAAAPGTVQPAVSTAQPAPQMTGAGRATPTAPQTVMMKRLSDNRVAPVPASEVQARLASKQYQMAQ